MSSYHGWTHAPKAQGGTDPVPFPSCHYALISSILNQTDPLEPDDERGFDISPVTDGYTSDASVLEPTDTGLQGIIVKETGFVIATARVIGWDNYTGAGTDVQDAVKGCAPIWDTGDFLGVVSALSNDASAVSAAANVADNNSLRTDSALLVGANQRVTMQCIQSSAVDAKFTQIDLMVAWIAAYPGSNGQSYSF